MSVSPRVGGDVDAFCTKCKMVLGHTVLAMVGARTARVRCNTCQGEHAFRSSEPGSTLKTAKPRRASSKAAPRDVAPSFDAMIEGRDISKPHRFSLNDIFVKGEVLDHPTFGVGVVLDVRGDRFDIVFKDGVKTLAQKKTSAVHSHRQERARNNDIPEHEDPSLENQVLTS